jgi:general stress protein YciG
MSPEKQREIASKGGRMAHEKGAAHEWTVDEAREAGRKGGCARHGRRMPPPDQLLVEPFEPMKSPTRWPEV